MSKLDDVGAFENTPTAIQLSNGKMFDLLNPKPELMDIDVIAGALSKLCRYNGQCSKFYTVAQHSVIVSKVVEPELAMDGLLHDASEAFMGDLSRPLKIALEKLAPGVIVEIEGGIHKAIAKRYGTSWPHSPLVKVADNIALATERRDLMLPNEVKWSSLPEPLPETLVPMPELNARASFIGRFRYLERLRGR